MITRYPHISAAAVLLTVLGVPFFLRTVAPAFEVYPSLVFPARATLVDVASGEVTYVQRELIGLREGQEVRLDPIRFLEPIPLQYLGVLFDRAFSLDPNDERRIYFKYLPVKERTVPRSQISEEEREETRNWLASRLEALGCDSDQLILRKKRYIVDRSTSTILDTEIIYERIVELD